MKSIFLPAVLILASASLLHAQSKPLLIAFGSPTINYPASSPYHQATWSSTYKTWNSVGNSNVSSGLLYGDGSAATGVSIALAAGNTYIANFATLPSNSGSPGTGAFTEAPYTTVFNPGTPVANAIWYGSSPTSSTSVGASVGGLAAGTYNVFVVGVNTGNNASPANPNGVEAENFYYSTSTGVPTGNVNTGKLKPVYTGTLNLTDTLPWIAGDNYVEIPQITITAGQNINIYGTGAGSGTNGESRGFLNSIEIVPVTPAAPPLLGLNTNEAVDSASTYYTTPTLVTTGTVTGVINQAGVNAIRDCPLWANCETTQGTITVPSAFVTYIDNAVASGITPVILLAYGNPLYDGGGYPQSATGMQAYANYCCAVVNQFKGKVHYYQVWNEWEQDTGNPKGTPKDTTAQYINLLKVVYPQIKAIDPTITVLGSAIVTAPGDATLKTALADGELSYCDAIDLHYNTYATSTDPYASLENWYIQMSGEPAVIQAANNGAPFPIYNTEMCWPSHIGAGGSTQEEQAQFLARYYLLGSTMPYLSGLFWNELHDQDALSSDPSGNQGVLRNDFTPKLAWTALSDLMSYLNGATFSDRINAGSSATNSDPNVFFLRFKESTGNYFIAGWSEWADDDWQMYLSVPSGTPNPNVNVVALGHGGFPTSFTTTTNNTSNPALPITIRRNPVIVEGPCVQNANSYMYYKVPFPEATRTLTQETTNVPPDGAGSNGGP